jgi:hypothetical protein
LTETVLVGFQFKRDCRGALLEVSLSAYLTTASFFTFELLVAPIALETCTRTLLAVASFCVAAWVRFKETIADLPAFSLTLAGAL